MEEKIRLSKSGYDNYLIQIKEKEKELVDLRIYKGTDAIFQGDNWHDNPTLYETERQERTLMKEISKMKENLEKIEIVENIGDNTLIDIDDIVKIDMIFSDGDVEEVIYKLIGDMPKYEDGIEYQEISINSPIGNAIYHKKIGDICSYEVGDNRFTIKIKERIYL